MPNLYTLCVVSVLPNRLAYTMGGASNLGKLTSTLFNTGQRGNNSFSELFRGGTMTLYYCYVINLLPKLQRVKPLIQAE